MNKKIYKKIAGTMLAGTMVCVSSMSVDAMTFTDYDKNASAVETIVNQTGTVSITQSASFLREETSKQEYSFSYRSSETLDYNNGCKFVIYMTKGFNPETIDLGAWADYDKPLSLEIISNGQVVDTVNGNEGEEIDLSKYTDISCIAVSPDLSAGNVNFEKLILTGTMDTKKTGEVFKLSGTYFGLKNENNEQDEIICSKEISTKCQYLIPTKPVTSLTKSELSYKDETSLVVDNIGGAGNCLGDSYTTTIAMPSRMHISTVVVPEFDNADCVLMFNGKKYTPENGIVNLDATANTITLQIKPADKEFHQTKPMEIKMSNAVNSNGSGNVYVTSQSRFANDCILSETNDKTTINFKEYDVPSTDITTPTEPDTSGGKDTTDKETIILVPDKPAKPSENNSNVSSEKNDKSESSSSLFLDPLGLLNNSSSLSGSKSDYTFIDGDNSLVLANSGNKSKNSTSSVGTIYDTVTYDGLDEEGLIVNSSDDKDSISNKINEKQQKKSVSDMAEDVQSNRGIQMGVIAAIIVATCAVVGFILFKTSKKDENNNQ